MHMYYGHRTEGLCSYIFDTWHATTSRHVLLSGPSQRSLFTTEMVPLVADAAWPSKHSAWHSAWAHWALCWAHTLLVSRIAHADRGARHLTGAGP
jgi:hypothetical protein